MKFKVEAYIPHRYNHVITTWYFYPGSLAPQKERPPKHLEYWEVTTNFERDDFMKSKYFKDENAALSFIRRVGKFHERER